MRQKNTPAFIKVLTEEETELLLYRKRKLEKSSPTKPNTDQSLQLEQKQLQLLPGPLEAVCFVL